MNNRRAVFFSGIAPGDSGTGLLVEWLWRQGCDVVFRREATGMARRRAASGHLVAAAREAIEPRFSRRWFALRLRLEEALSLSEVILLHPQTIGMGRSIKFIRKRRRPPWLLLLDNCYFCIRSYNHLPGEFRACVGCLGGQFEAMHHNCCEPFPIPDPAAENFVRDLFELVGAGRVRLLAQCASQARLARRHFGVEVPVVGLWTAGWKELFEAQPVKGAEPHDVDVLFHGHWIEAKGASWLLEVARLCSELRFLFPCAALDYEEELPPNCKFQPMTWDSGLSAVAVRAEITVIPSLWSSPIEGAVIKSLLCGKSVAVVANRTSFVSEIPDDVVLHLPAEPTAAANRLKRAIHEHWRPRAESRDRWLCEFTAANASMVRSIYNMTGSRGAPGGLGEWR